MFQAQAEKLKAELEAARDAKKNAGSAATPVTSGGKKTQEEDNVNTLCNICPKMSYKTTNFASKMAQLFVSSVPPNIINDRPLWLDKYIL